MRGLLDGAGAAAGIDFRDCEYFVGTSAGSIVASFLAAGRAPDSGAEARAAKDWAEAGRDATTAAPAASPRLGRLGRRARGAARAARARLGGARRRRRACRRAQGRAADAALDARPRPPRSTRRARASTGGCGSSRSTGAAAAASCSAPPTRPRATVGQAVLASCSVPWVFAPVRIGEREYVDGGVWSPTNLDAAPARRGSEVLCLNPTASLPAGRARALRAFSRSAAAAETLALRARGATVRTIGPDARAAEAMGVNLMDRGRVAAGAGRRLRPGQGAARHEPPGRQPGAVGHGRPTSGSSRPSVDWASPDPSWGIWRDPRGRGRRAARRRRARRDRARLRHRLLLGLARPPRRAAGRRRPVARASSPPRARCRPSTASSSR